MAFRLNDSFGQASGPEEDPLQAHAHLLKTGSPAQRQKALKFLVRQRAEGILTECLRHKDPLTVSMAINGLWDCWLNEKGRNARRRIDAGILFMENQQFQQAEQSFLGLMADFPDWAEAINKQATLNYLRGQAAVGLTLCQTVVRMKPNHFGAWNGLALCAAQLEKWSLVRDAAKAGIQLIPGSEANEHLLALALSHLDQE